MIVKEFTGDVPKAFRKDEMLMISAAELAIEDAERFGTPLVIKRNGRIEEVSPKTLKRRLKRKH